MYRGMVLGLHGTDLQSLGAEPWCRLQSLYRRRKKKQKKKMKSLAEFVVIDTYDYDTYIKVVSSL